MARELILASASPYRRRLLAKTGIAFRVAAAPIEEESIRAFSPARLARLRAAAKASAVSTLKP